MKAVVDTNVFISSFLNPKGTPRKVISLWKTGELIICLSAEILEEYIEVLIRMGLKDEPETGELLELFRKRINIDFVAIDQDIKLIASDPDDDKFIECAVNAGAEVIITGDRHLKDLKQYKGIDILSPAEFIDFWQR